MWPIANGTNTCVCPHLLAFHLYCFKHQRHIRQREWQRVEYTWTMDPKFTEFPDNFSCPYTSAEGTAAYKRFFWQKIKILHIFRGFHIISTFCLTFCNQQSSSLICQYPSLRFQLHSHFLNWQWLSDYIWDIKMPANRILLPWKINRSLSHL